MVKRYGWLVYPISNKLGGLECKPVTGEVTYGLERLAMYIQGVDSMYISLVWRPSWQNNLRWCIPSKQKSSNQLTTLNMRILIFLFYCFDQYERKQKALN